MPKTTAKNPHDRRMQATAEKLRAALARLTGRSAEYPAAPTRRLTVAALAREARVGRNAIYANHRDILDDLARALQRQRVPSRIATIADKVAEQRVVIDDMQRQIRQLATENAGLMRRAIEAERWAERAERRSAQLTREIDAHRRPAILRSTQP
ncbi:hypothetical protein ACI7BZ_21015 [Xanthobacter sp. AM11]|uniref:hypothetical protein n=1 Tax=Xanthobacter sp. AM11 TaxID=3380643 RepID=UPI0039BEEEBF